MNAGPYSSRFEWEPGDVEPASPAILKQLVMLALSLGGLGMTIATKDDMTDGTDDPRRLFPVIRKKQSFYVCILGVSEDGTRAEPILVGLATVCGQSVHLDTDDDELKATHAKLSVFERSMTECEEKDFATFLLLLTAERLLFSGYCLTAGTSMVAPSSDIEHFRDLVTDIRTRQAFNVYELHHAGDGAIAADFSELGLVTVESEGDDHFQVYSDSEDDGLLNVLADLFGRSE